MGVEQVDRRRPALQAFAEDLPRLDRDAAHRAAKHLAFAEQEVPGVEEESPHHLLVAGLVAEGEIARHVHRAGERLAVQELLAGEPAAELDRRQ